MTTPAVHVHLIKEAKCFKAYNSPGIVIHPVTAMWISNEDCISNSSAVRISKENCLFKIQWQLTIILLREPHTEYKLCGVMWMYQLSLVLKHACLLTGILLVSELHLHVLHSERMNAVSIVPGNWVNKQQQRIVHLVTSWIITELLTADLAGSPVVDNLHQYLNS